MEQNMAGTIGRKSIFRFTQMKLILHGTIYAVQCHCSMEILICTNEKELYR